MRWPKGRFNLKHIYLGNFYPWRQVEHVEYIKSLGWKCPPATPDNPWPWNKNDCLYEVHRNWQKYMKRGFDSITFRASIDIREDRMTRNQALELINKYQGKEPEDMTDFLADINVTEEEFVQMTLRHKVT